MATSVGRRGCTYFKCLACILSERESNMVMHAFYTRLNAHQWFTDKFGGSHIY